MLANTLQDIASREDISHLVVTFYTRAFADPELGPVFTDIARMDLPAHLPIMCDFWQKVLFQTGTYGRDAFTVHRDLNAKVPLTKELFQRWEDLWHETVDDLFVGEKANLAKLHGSRMSGSIQRRLATGTRSDFLQIAQREGEIRLG